jgi:subtilisin family serine protease
MLPSYRKSQARHAHKIHALSALALAALLAGCGGSGDSSAEAGSFTIAGTIADGPLEGARVFLDLNSNFEHDSNEPISQPSDAGGAFSLVIDQMDQNQLATAQLVSQVPSTARDADDGGPTLAQAGRAGFYLASPVSEFLELGSDGKLNKKKDAFVSPLTTLVAAEMALNGLTLADARQIVRQTLGLDAQDPMENFVTTRNAGLGQLARATADELGGIGQTVSAIATLEGGQAVKEQIRDIVATLKNRARERSAPNDQPGIESVEDGGITTSPERSDNAPAPAGQSFSDYVVVFKDVLGKSASAAVKEAKADVLSKHRGTVKFTYDTAIKGFAVRLPAAAAEAFLEAMENNPNVERVELDIPMQAFRTTQEGATWGLDRSDQRDLPLNTSYSYDHVGKGVRAYIVDTGILASHTDFGDRVISGYDVIDDSDGTNDCNGHGTHVAGTVGSTTWGIAKQVTLVPVRVLDCNGSGTLSGVIAGLDWVAKNGSKPAVVNMSLGGGASTSLDSAVANTVAKGYTVVVAAGNSHADACRYSPAREPSAITVGATTSTDFRASYSNYGSCLDLFAPGSSIKSTWYTSTTATATLNGTSMASPHVAGLAALLLEKTPDASASTITNAILEYSTRDKVQDAGRNSPNRLIYTLGSNDTPPPPEPETTVVGVAQLTGSATSFRNGWRAYVDILVTDGTNPVSGANVTGSFTVGGSSVACTTGSNGSCSVSTGNLSKNIGSTTYTVENITGTSLSFDGVNASVKVDKPQ